MENGEISLESSVKRKRDSIDHDTIFRDHRSHSNISAHKKNVTKHEERMIYEKENTLNQESKKNEIKDRHDSSPALLMTSEEEDRIILERKRIREEILKKYDNNMNVDSPKIESVEIDTTQIAQEDKNGENSAVADDDDSDDDMFADDFKIKKSTVDVQQITSGQLLDNFDDHEGYYRCIIGEIIDERYVVGSIVGKGVFSSVLKAKDLKEDKEVAIKILRNNDIMYKTGLKELSLLEKFKAADPMDKKHVLRFLGSFQHRNHLCLVFESLSMNLREVLQKYGRNVGLNIKAIKSYAYQLFLSLSLLKQCKIIHADIKPDNILVNENKSLLKLCDFGSASDISENDITPYLVSRFYRAPEIILGAHYDYAIDVWSVACSLFELFTGRLLFPGRNNNQMLKLMMEVKGRVPVKLIKKGTLSHLHFDKEDNFSFLSNELDRVSQQEVIKKIHFNKPTKELKFIIENPNDDPLIVQFIDFLEKCLQLGPEKRLTVEEAFQHPFLK